VIAHCVTLATAKAHLGILTPAGHVDDPALALQLDAAEAAVLRYVAKSAYGAAFVATWVDPAATDPDAVAAILLVLGELHRFKGDDLEGAGPPRRGDEDLAPPVIGLLRRFTDPVLA
jgi:hypothetical protein